jgi:hypothetical protein
MRILSYFLVAAFSGSFGASLMALLIAGAKQDRETEKRDDETFR